MNQTGCHCRAALAAVLLSAVLPGVRAQDGPVFPRRALVISVHDYLYANAVHPGEAQEGQTHAAALAELLAKGQGFRIPASQVLHLSDGAKQPNPPLKSVIEATLTTFLASSRAEDRIVVLFAGHGVEFGGEAYLVPIEGLLDAPKTLVPLRWVFEKMKECKARQKVLILDVCRQSPTRRSLRPAFGPMTAGLVGALKKAPAGVQVWVSCGENETSHETEDLGSASSVFLEAMARTEAKGAGTEQKPSDSIPLDKLAGAVSRHMTAILKPLERSQTAWLFGEENKDGAAYSPREPAPRQPAIEGLTPANKLPALDAVQGIFREANVPGFRKAIRTGTTHLAGLPLYNPAELARVAKGDAPAKIKQAIDGARVLLWASSGETPPPDLAAAVRAARRGDASAVLLPFAEWLAPGPGARAEAAFKNSIFEQSRVLASVIRLFEEMLEELKTAAAEPGSRPRRWQAHLDYLTARTQMQLAFLNEYASMLGSLRKDWPLYNPNIHGGWVLAPREKMAGSADGKKLAREAQKGFDKILANYPGTPWEVLARRDKLTALGLQWVPRR